MTAPEPLAVDALYRRCETERFDFDTTAESGRGRQNEANRARIYPDDVLVAPRTPWVQRPGGLLEALMGDAQWTASLLGEPAPRATVSAPMVLLDGSDVSTRAL